MKMLFYSSDSSEVDRVSKEFLNAGILCEVRIGPAVNGSGSRPPQAELWIRNDTDCHRAFMLCVHLGVGFAKRAPRKPTFDGEDFEVAMEAEREPEAEAAPNGKETHRMVYAKRASG
jgi:hypothetical protein